MGCADGARCILRGRLAEDRHASLCGTSFLLKAASSDEDNPRPEVEFSEIIQAGGRHLARRDDFDFVVSGGPILCGFCKGWARPTSPYAAETRMRAGFLELEEARRRMTISISQPRRFFLNVTPSTEKPS